MWNDSLNAAISMQEQTYTGTDGSLQSASSLTDDIRTADGHTSGYKLALCC